MISKTLTTYFGGIAIYLSLFITGILPICSQAQVTPADLLINLQGHYTLDNVSANDFSGNNNNGTKYGNPVSGTDRYGNTLGAIDFDGSNDYINTNTTYDYQHVTVAFWAKPDLIPSSTYMVAVSQEDNTLNYGSLGTSFQTSGQIKGKIRSDYINPAPLLLNSFSPNQWYHITLLSNGTSCKYYINGNLVYTNGVGTGPQNSGTNQFVIGIHRDLSSRRFNGVIDDVRIYNRALSDEEVAYLHCPAQVDIDLNDTTIYTGTTLTFNNYQTEYIHNWSVNGTNINSDTAFSYQFTNSGNYEVVLTSTDGYCSNSDTVNVIVSNPSCYPSNIYTQYDGMILDCPFNGNANDYSGNNYNTVPYNVTLVNDRKGNPNSAYQFNGTSSTIIINNNNPIVNNTTFTISAWVKMYGIGNGTQNQNNIFTQRSNSTYGASTLGLNAEGAYASGTTRMGVRTNGNYFEHVSATRPSYNTWSHIVGLCDGVNLKLYIDGLHVGTTTFTQNGSSINTNIAHVEIGRHQFGGTIAASFNGVIDDVRIYDRVLSDEEIAYFYCPVQTDIIENDTTIISGTTLTFNNVCNEFPNDWDVNSAFITTDTSFTHQFVNAGLNQVVLSSTDGFCTQYDTVNVTVIGNPCGSIDTVPAFKIDATCYGSSDGVMSAQYINGTPPYQYNWSNGDTTDTITNLLSGNYSVTIQDSTGCIQVAFDTINQPDSITIQFVSINATCDSANDGSLTAIASGGAGDYSYNWSTGSQDSTIQNIISNYYTITVTDSSNCSNSMIGFIGHNDIKPNFSLGNDTTFCAGDSIILFDTTDSVNKLWSDGTIEDSISIFYEGSYWLKLTDSIGCSNTDSINVREISPSIFDLGTDSTICYNLNFAPFEIGTDSIGSYIWNTGDTTNYITISDTGKYVLDFYNSYGCFSSDSIHFDFTECYGPIIYPIPTVDYLYVEWPSPLGYDVTYTLIDMKGSMVWQETKTSSQFHKFYMKSVSHGAYFLIIESTEFKMQYRIVKS